MTVGAGPVEFHVNGLCRVYCFSPKVYLGYTSEAGVRVETDPKYDPIYTDAYGSQVPEDVQNMGMLATMSFELIKWDQTVLADLQGRLSGVGGASANNVNGASPNSDGSGNLLIGALYKQCGYAFPVIIERGGNVGCENNVEGPYDFSTCYVGMDSFNMGTRNTRHQLTIHCLPNASGVLYTISSGA